MFQAEDPTSQQAAFGELLRVNRQRALLSQQQLAAASGVSDRTIRNLESARVKSPHVATARLLATALGLSGATLDAFIAAAAASPNPARTNGSHVGEQFEVEHWRRARPAQLPMTIRGFSGRRRELAELDTILEETGDPGATLVIVITGGAGTGKTTTALHWAHRVKHKFPDGQLYVNMRGIEGEGAELPTSDAVRGLLDALGVSAAVRPPTFDAQASLYRTMTADQRLLVLLDNALSAEHARALIPSSASCVTIVTSRDPMAGLVVREGAHRLRLGLLEHNDAQELLRNRLGAYRSNETPAAVSDIVHACGRLPLALSVVAARARLEAGVPLTEIASGLRRSVTLDGLDLGDPSLDVRGVFSWSYQALSEAAAEIFRIIGNHPTGAFDLPALAAAARRPERQIRALMRELEQANLVEHDESDLFSSHDLVQTYASELAQHLDGADVRAEVADRFANHYLAMSKRAANLLDPIRNPDSVLPEGADVLSGDRLVDTRQQAMEWFDLRRHTLRALVADRAGRGDHARCWAIADAMGLYLQRTGRWTDQIAVQTKALRAADHLARSECKASSNRYLAWALRGIEQLDEACARLWEAVKLYGNVDDKVGQAACYIDIATVLADGMRYRDAIQLAEQARMTSEAAGDAVGSGRALNAIGWDLLQLGDFEQAVRYCGRAVEVLQRLGDVVGEAAALDSLGDAYRAVGLRDDAVDAYERAAKLCRSIDALRYEADVWTRLGDCSHEAGSVDSARQAWMRAVTVLREIKDVTDDELGELLMKLRSDAGAGAPSRPAA
jgi:tetratricopeptide (TPR) repeat protein/transcriptional regulator with XRE-family HTH domain